MIQAYRLDDLTRRHLRRLELLAHDVTAPFSCGGTVPLAAPPTLRFPTGHRLPLDLDRGSYRVVEALKRRARKARFGEGSSTRHDPRVRDGLQLSASGGAFTVEGFDPEALGILATARAALCPRDPSPLRAELYALNLYDSGGHFAPHKDTPRGDDMLGSLVIGLASLYEGGDLVIVHRGATETYAWGRRHLETEPHAGWAAFFGDVDHEVRSVSSGTRITLSYILRRGEGAALDVAAPHAQTEALADALSEALADRAFFPHGGVLGFSCFHLYSESPGLLRGATAITEATAGRLKGRDQHVAAAALRLGLVTRFVPYLVEQCAEERWALASHLSETQRMMFRRARLTASGIASKLKVPDDHHDDDSVTWVVVPRLDARCPLRDGPAAEFLGEVEYSSTGYFGNEGGPDAFYAHAALLVEVPPAAQRGRPG